MCPVQTVTHLSGRTFVFYSLQLHFLTKLGFLTIGPSSRVLPSDSEQHCAARAEGFRRSGNHLSHFVIGKATRLSLHTLAWQGQVCETKVSARIAEHIRKRAESSCNGTQARLEPSRCVSELARASSILKPRITGNCARSPSRPTKGLLIYKLSPER